VRFITSVVDGKLIIQKKKKQALMAEMRSLGFAMQS
jgi:hypothetical protein